MAYSAFPALKVLELRYLRSFEIWDVVKGHQGVEIMFPQLEELYVADCGKIKASSGQQKVCPKLTTKSESRMLRVLDMQGSEEEMFRWVARHSTSLTNLKLKNCQGTETTSVAAAVTENCLRQVVDTMEKWNHPDFSLADMELIGLKSGVTELCACFVQLQRLCITDCAALAHWPEAEFQGLVSLRSLNIISCEHLVGYAAEPSTTILLGRVSFTRGPQCWALPDPVVPTRWPASVPVSQSAQGLRLSWYEQASCLPAATPKQPRGDNSKCPSSRTHFVEAQDMDKWHLQRLVELSTCV